MRCRSIHIFFFFNDTATTEIYTLSLHDALPILYGYVGMKDYTLHPFVRPGSFVEIDPRKKRVDRKSTRLNSSHQIISYAVFCLKKKKTTRRQKTTRTTPSES